MYVMAEIPSNVILAEQFAELFDGFSIGSNDLTQLVLGVDRDSARVAPLFDERNEAVQTACAELIGRAHAAGRTVGICGQAPSDYPEFAEFLVRQGIDSISLNADALVRTQRRVARWRRPSGPPRASHAMARSGWRRWRALPRPTELCAGPSAGRPCDKRKCRYGVTSRPVRLSGTGRDVFTSTSRGSG